MKQICLIFTLMTIVAIQARAKPRQAPLSYHFVVATSRVDFQPDGANEYTKTFTITTPGQYSLVHTIPSELRAEPNKDAACVYINSNNVLFDLGGQTLWYNDSIHNQHGIRIASNKNNITIKCGNISNFTGNGIRIETGCDNIRVQDVTISSIRKEGILLNGTGNNSIVSNCIIHNCIISSCSGYAPEGVHASGIKCQYTCNLTIEDTTSGHQVADVGSDAYGVYLVSCTNILCSRVDGSGNTGENGYGFGLSSNCIGCSFADCNAIGNVGIRNTTGIGAGFMINNSTCLSFLHSTALRNEGIGAGYGFYMNTSSFNLFKECHAKSNRCSDYGATGAKGFYSTLGTGNIFSECDSLGNQAGMSTAQNNSDAFSVGFELSQEQYSRLYSCYATSNGNATKQAYGVGIYIQNSTQCSFEKCTIANNRSIGTNKGIGLWDTSSASTSLIINCFTFGNNDAQNNNNNFVVTYPGRNEELDITSQVTVGSISGLSAIKPFQNTEIIPS